MKRILGESTPGGHQKAKVVFPNIMYSGSRAYTVDPKACTLHPEHTHGVWEYFPQSRNDITINENFDACHKGSSKDQIRRSLETFKPKWISKAIRLPRTPKESAKEGFSKHLNQNSIPNIETIECA